jgi:rhamnulokinase
VGALVRCVLESLALAYREVLERVQAISNQPLSNLHIVGGGTQNGLLNQLTATATGLPVVTGPIEATVMGNALVQFITLGEIADLPQARQIMAGLDELQTYLPEETAVFNEAYGRYQRMVQSQRLDHSETTT